jgi:hypothetical protein
VPLDPQREKFFIDARHLAFLMQPEAGVLSLGAWSADRLGSASVTGPRLPGGNVEILPGDGVSSRVSVRTSDSIHLAFRSVRHDVHHLVLFSR